MKRQTVNLPIVVPIGKYCWEFNSPGTCDYHDNEGGHSKCLLGFNITDTKKGILKDSKCEALKIME